MSDDFDTEVDANFEAFREKLPDLIKAHQGQYVLLRHREIEGFFVDVKSAIETGMSRFSDQLFSVQEVTTKPADLGFFSHAIDLGFA